VLLCIFFCHFKSFTKFKDPANYHPIKIFTVSQPFRLFPKHATIITKDCLDFLIVSCVQQNSN
jgi:hypothetical protein